MATLKATSYPGFEQLPGEDFDTYCHRTGNLLKGLQDKADSLPEGEIVGGLITFPVADGQAMYLVVKDKPLTLQHIPFGDAWTIPEPHIRGLRKADVEQKIHQARALRKLFGG